MTAGVTGRIVAAGRRARGAPAPAAEHGPLMLFQSGGCCDGSLPICLRDGELVVAPDDLLLGEVDGCHVHIDEERYER